MPVIERRNIVLVLYDALSALGYPVNGHATLGPVLDGLAEKSLTFSQTYAPSPDGGPACASLFTGLDPAAHGVWSDGVTLPLRERVFPETMTQAGYNCSLVGRRHLAGVAHWTTEHARPYEYDRFLWAHGPLHRSRQNAYLGWLQQQDPELYTGIFPTQPNPDDTTISPQQRAAMAALPDGLSFNHWVGQQVCAQIDEGGSGRPFLAIAGLVVGAHQGAPLSGSARCEPCNARALVQADAALGSILNTVAASPAADETVVIVTSARGAVPKADSSPAMQESALRVPMILHGAGIAPQDVADPVSTLDLVPTVLALAGLPLHPRLQGVSLLEIAQGARAARGWALSRLRRGGRDGPRQWQTALRYQDHKLVTHHGDPRIRQAPTYQLYDLAEDPLEQSDLAGRPEHRRALERMVDLMIDARCAMEDRTEPRIASF